MPYPGQPKLPSSCHGPPLVEASNEPSHYFKLLENLVSSGALQVTKIPQDVPVEQEKSPTTSKDSSRESLHPEDFPDKSQTENYYLTHRRGFHNLLLRRKPP